MNIHEIETLVELVAASGVAEVTVRTDARRITIRKAPPAPRPAAQSVALVAAAAAGTARSSAETPLVPAPSAPAKPRAVKAPMVGIFHHAEPPVAPGTQIEAGRVVGVIESMKLMNDVRADASGVVTEIAIEAGMAVEFGQPLFILGEQREPGENRSPEGQ